ncbi:unnamed protein product [Gulo gulo]|uniref:60S ribosomal protein L29 n=1 Tax=Gulo gulo TaxID=48420 RepID=A0A9X9MB41_GULGU|nr:unnamed protein product [Gulo gulo]
MAKSENHTTHNLTKWHRNGIRKAHHKDMHLLTGRTPSSEEHALCQEAQQEGPEQDAGQQGQGHVCTCRGYRGPRQTQGSQAQDPKGSNHKLNRLAYITCL